MLLACTACGDEDGVPEEVVAAEDDPATHRNFELLDVVAVDDGTVEFGRLDSGGIVVVEEIASGGVSPVDALMTGQQASPLEMYLAIAPPDRAVPQAIVQAHDRFASEQGIAAEPRALRYEPEDAGFRAEYSWIYLANCNLPADGGWFDDFWQTYGWNWHWYVRDSYSSWNSPFTGNTQAVQAHICNDGPSGGKNFWVEQRDGIDNCAPGTWHNLFWKLNSPTEHRVQFRVWNDPLRCQYRAKVTQPIGQGAHPTYSLGITRP